MTLLITLVATRSCWQCTQTLDDLAAGPIAGATDLDALRSPSPVVHAAGGLLLLIAATALAVFKPAGADPLRLAQAAATALAVLRQLMALISRAARREHTMTGNGRVSIVGCCARRGARGGWSSGLR